MPVKTKKKPISRTKHFVHHRHSFKLVPHHHTSYPLIAMMLMFVAIFSVGWSTFVMADTNGGSISVRAVILAEVLTEPATLDAPADQQHFTDNIITAAGGCPVNSYVNLQRNGAYAGTAPCDTDGRWSIELSLVAGANVLQPQAYNVTDVAGPQSPSRTVYYDVPTPPEITPPADSPNAGPSQAQTPGASPTQSSVPPLVLSGSFSLVGVLAGNELVQTFTINGGSAPYAISIDWGDGTTDLISRATAGEFTARHKYISAGTGAQNSFTIRLEASDNDGMTSVLQTMVIVNPLPGTGITQAGKGGILDFFMGKDGQSAYDKFWQIAGPTYVLTAVATLSFWFGQRRELEILQRIPKNHRHKHA